MRYITHLLSLALVLAATTSSAGPQWPQSFNLRGSSSANYNFEVRRPGAVVVTVQWQGIPVTIKLTKSDGQQIYSNVKMSPGQIQTTATADDVRKGAVWKMEIYPDLGKPDPNAKNGAWGTVSVQVPAIADTAMVSTAKAGQVALRPAPGSNTAPTPGKPTPPPPPPPPPPSQANNSTFESNQTCFAYTRTNGGFVSVQCSWRRDWCEEHVRNKTAEGGNAVPGMTVVLGCSPAPLYCFGYNNGNSGACFASGNECVTNRNSFASRQNGAYVGACKTYVGGVVRN